MIVKSQLDITTAEDPDIESRVDQAIESGSNALSIFEGMVESLAIFMELVGQFSVLKQVLGSREDAKIFGLLCVARPLMTYMLVFKESTRT